MQELHAKYNLKTIKYLLMDAENMPDDFTETFDIVVFKAVFGGIRNRQEAVDEIYRVLKPGGVVIFCDSNYATKFHNFVRKHFGSNWHYFKEEEIMSYFKAFRLIDRKYYGFIAPFSRVLGNHHKIRQFFGKMDSDIFEKIVPENNRYIGCYCFQKI